MVEPGSELSFTCLLSSGYVDKKANLKKYILHIIRNFTHNTIGGSFSNSVLNFSLKLTVLCDVITNVLCSLISSKSLKQALNTEHNSRNAGRKLLP